MTYKQMFYLGNYSIGFSPKDENGCIDMYIIVYDENGDIHNDHVHLITSNEGYEIIIDLINDYEDATNSEEADKAKLFFEYITGIERG